MVYAHALISIICVGMLLFALPMGLFVQFVHHRFYVLNAYLQLNASHALIQLTQH